MSREVEWHRRTPSSEEVEQVATMLEQLAKDLRGLGGRIIYVGAGFVRDENTTDLMLEGYVSPTALIRDETNTLDLHIEVEHRR